MDEADDEDLMLRYAGGDAEAFEVLYRRRRDGLYRYLSRTLRDRTAVDEVFQEVWLDLVRSRERYRPEARFTTFLFQLAHNRCVDRWRRGQGDAPLDAVPEPADPAPGPEQRADGRQRGQALLDALAALPADQREAFLMREEGEMSVEEIARVTGVPRETAKSRLRYALARLRRELAPWL